MAKKFSNPNTMSNPFHNFDWSFKSIAKIFGMLILGIVGLSLVAMIVSFSFKTIVSPFTQNSRSGYGIGGGSVMMEKAMSSYDEGMDSSYSYSTNITPPIPDSTTPTDAEDYEVKEYYATYRTRNKDEACSKILELKSDEDIIFSSANEGKTSCYYSFKAINAKADQVLDLLNSLDPETLNANTYTIKRVVENQTDRLEVLKQKLAQTQSTLEEAQSSYDELTRLAKNRGDVENLTKLIDLKINTIERLAKERININDEMERVERNRNEQLERLAYTQFNVNVYEEKFVDWKQIGESWKNEIRNFVNNLNDLTQFVSVKLVSFTLYSLSALLYIAIAFAFLKLIWLLGKKVWKYEIRK